jgi:hypothetical protein
MAAEQEQVRTELPESVRPTFDQLVEEYRFHALLFHGRPFVSYKVLAALVSDGWRPSGESVAGKIEV